MRVRKVFIKNNKTGKMKYVQYNPETLEYSRGATYKDISAPGIGYPWTQFVKGEIRSFSIELFVYDKPYSGLCLEWEKFLEGFLPPINNVVGYVKCPDMIFCYGSFVGRFVLTDLKTKHEMFNKNLKPTQTRFTLTLRQVGT